MSVDVVIGMAGAGGDGIVSAGEALIAAAAASGYHAVMTKSFGSQIRGGESSCRLRLSTQPVLNPGGALDVAVALNWDDFVKFGAELPVGGETVLIHDSKTPLRGDDLAPIGVAPAESVAVPLAEIARAAAGNERAKNAVVLGLLSRWLGVRAEPILERLRKKLAHRGPELIAANERAFQSGIDYAIERPLLRTRALDPPESRTAAKLLADGNEMCGAAAIFAGCRFFGGYPITPSSEIMQFLSREIWAHGGAMLQAEDEIAGIGAAVGASFAGQKAMTATSGPGLSLKTEMLGLATIAELPLVLVDVQRGGPSTGIPTKSEQSDLFAAVFSGHGDVARPVLAPTSVADTFAVTVEAFNIAERFQTPVVILSDQEIAQRKETVDAIETAAFVVEERRRPGEAELHDYARFRLTESGVSPIARPGEAGYGYLGSGIEHDEHGHPTASGAMHTRMNRKRFKKLLPLKARRDLFLLEGEPRAPLALVSWGSSAGVCREALRLARSQGLRVKLLAPRLLYPIAEEVYREFFASVRAGLVVEQSHQGQLYRLLRMFLEVPSGIEPMARSGANPFMPQDVLSRLHEAAASMQRLAGQARPPQE